MTKTYRARANGHPYEMTVTESSTPTGKPGVRITCTCPTHPEGKNAAIVATPSGLDFPKANIHGHVTGVHHPAVGPMMAKTGKAWAA
jgi:hypothetical protein